MTVFGRRRRRRAEELAEGQDGAAVETGAELDSGPDGDFVDDLDEDDREREDALLLAEIEAREAELVRQPPPRPTGPWDAADAPEDDVARIDLGGLLVPAPEGAEVRLELGEQGEIAAVSVLRGEGASAAAVQLSAFAAPRSEGIWQEVLEEITDSLTGTGGTAERVEGPWGVEVRAAVPTQGANGALVLAPLRFAGVDGPRWFLRALFSGAAASDPEAAAPLEQVVRDVVVVRGADPMAVKDPLALRMPPEAAAVPEPDEDEEDDDGDPLALPERGPEITETR